MGSDCLCHGCHGWPPPPFPLVPALLLRLTAPPPLRPAGWCGAARRRSDLSVTETELRVARTALSSASGDLSATTARLEAVQGELGLTRSENELMKVRELPACLPRCMSCVP